MNKYHPNTIKSNMQNVQRKVIWAKCGIPGDVGGAMRQAASEALHEAKPLLSVLTLLKRKYNVCSFCYIS